MGLIQAHALRRPCRPTVQFRPTTGQLADTPTQTAKSRICTDWTAARKSLADVAANSNQIVSVGMLKTSKRSPTSIFPLLCIFKLEMWTNAQRGGRPVEYRWRPLFNAAVWLTPNTGVQCSNTAKTRSPLKFAGVPQTTGSISAATGPKFTIL